MSTQPVPYQQPHATPAGQPPNDIGHEADKFLTAINDALAQHRTSHRDHSPLPSIGTSPPVTQPGRPPMSASAVDYSTRILSTGVASVLFSGGASLILVASGQANPTVIALIAGAPLALAVPILALTRLAARAKDVLPPEHHHHYNGPVHQNHHSTHTTTRGFIATTRNDLPR